MTLKPPHVYIGRTLMNNYALSATPMLAGLSFDWGTDSQIDFEEPATLSADLLVKEPSNTDFLAKGAPLGVLDPDSGETLFAGRITTLKAKNHPTKKGAMLISITAADTLADLNGYRVSSVDWPAPLFAEYPQYATTGRQRREQLAAALPRDWSLAGTTSHDWYTARPQRWGIEPYLPLLDMHLRACIGRRHNTSRYVPGTGLENRLTVTDERGRELPTEKLAARTDGTWYMSIRTPPTSAAVALTGRQVAADIEWEKTPDDTVTDVALKSWGITYGTDRETGEVNTDPSSDEDIWVGFRVDLEAWQRRHGFHSVAFDVDTFGNPPGGIVPPGSGGADIIEDIANYWLDGDTQWRPTAVTIPDSRRLSDALVLNLLSVTRRYTAYATIDGLPENNPAGGSRVRGFVIAGSAEWTGKKWVMELTLGRVPRPHPDAGTLTFETIRNHGTAAIKNGTAETVGSALSFADFAYIGD